MLIVKEIPEKLFEDRLRKIQLGDGDVILQIKAEISNYIKAGLALPIIMAALNEIFSMDDRAQNEIAGFVSQIAEKDINKALIFTLRRRFSQKRTEITNGDDARLAKMEESQFISEWINFLTGISQEFDVSVDILLPSLMLECDGFIRAKNPLLSNIKISLETNKLTNRIKSLITPDNV